MSEGILSDGIPSETDRVHSQDHDVGDSTGSEQSEEEKARIRKEWDETLTRIQEANKAAALVEWPRSEGTGLTDEDIDNGSDCCEMCNGGLTIRRDALD